MNTKNPGHYYVWSLKKLDIHKFWQKSCTMVTLILITNTLSFNNVLNIQGLSNHIYIECNLAAENALRIIGSIRIIHNTFR